MDTPKTRPGYAFSFDAAACRTCGGACCNGESGEIFINSREADAIASHLHLSTETFRKRYTKKLKYKTSLIEVEEPGNFRCVFFEASCGCTIYPVRPMQCRTYPFWGRFKDDPSALAKECPGIRLHD